MTSAQPSKLKLVYIVTQAEWGGAQRYIFDLATALKNEFDITVAAGAEGSQELLQKCQRANIHTHTFKNLVREISPLKDIAAISEVARFLKQEKPNIIHLNSSKAGIVGTLACTLQHMACKIQNLKKSEICNLKSEIIYTAHGWVFNEPLPWWRKKLYMQMERIACKIHRKAIVLSKADFDTAVKNNICPPEKMTIIPHGIKLINFLPGDEARKKLAATYNLSSRSPEGRQPTTLWLGTIANLYKTKGINYLIDAVAILRDQGVEPTFIVIGDGPELKNYELRIKNYGLNNFLLIGSLENAAQYLKSFDIFVLPSVKEGLPYALLEAMQAGLPIITTKVGAIPEMLENEKDGLMVPPADSKILAETIQRLLNNHDLRENLSQRAALKFQEKFSFNKMLSKTKLLYDGNLI